jgi:hypothetical protein
MAALDDDEEDEDEEDEKESDMDDDGEVCSLQSNHTLLCIIMPILNFLGIEVCRQ